MCSLDWEIIKDILVALISAGIPSLVAWCIFRGWNSQKGTEVLAIEAKEVIINLSTLQSLQSEINSDLFYVFLSGKFDLEKRNEFELIYKKLARSIDFIGVAIVDDNLSHYSTSVLSQAYLFLRDVDRIYDGTLKTGNINLINPSDAFRLTSMMLDLALYKTVNKKIFKIDNALNAILKSLK